MVVRPVRAEVRWDRLAPTTCTMVAECRWEVAPNNGATHRNTVRPDQQALSGPGPPCRPAPSRSNPAPCTRMRPSGIPRNLPSRLNGIPASRSREVKLEPVATPNTAVRPDRTHKWLLRPNKVVQLRTSLGLPNKVALVNKLVLMVVLVVNNRRLVAERMRNGVSIPVSSAVALRCRLIGMRLDSSRIRRLVGNRMRKVLVAASLARQQLRKGTTTN